MSFEMIKTDQVDRVAIVTLNRPEVLNALNLQMVRELDEFVTQAEQDEGIGAIVITGAGERAFRQAPTSMRTGKIQTRSGPQARPRGPGTRGG